MGSKKFTVGYFYRYFPQAVTPHLDSLSEVFFSWPGTASCRNVIGSAERLLAMLVPDLLWARKQGLRLNLLFNASCYGEKASTQAHRAELNELMKSVDSYGLFPDIITTSSPYIAKVFKSDFSGVEVRASINMRVNSVLTLECLAPWFDSFYIWRDVQRDLKSVKLMSKWCAENDRKLGILVNSGCLNSCPWQSYHESLMAHNFPAAAAGSAAMDVPATVCHHNFANGRYGDVLRSGWIRPDDLHIFEPYFSFIKLATRTILRPAPVLKAYIEGKYSGDMLALLDPCYAEMDSPVVMDNTAFPPGWTASGIAGGCAMTCTKCGGCERTLEQVIKPRQRVSGIDISKLSFK